MLEILHLSFDYAWHPLLRDINFEVRNGSSLHLLGANGAGKTTLLKLIAGLYHPLQGKILFDSSLIHDDLEHYQKQCCYIGHKTGINPLLTVRENWRFDLQGNKALLDFEGLARVFQLEAMLDIPCSQLSAGQKRQVALLRLWFSDARLWLLDEPLCALDETACNILTSKIDEHVSNKGMVLFTSHQKLALRSATQDYRL
jgi:heme exporter protein A